MKKWIVGPIAVAMICQGIGRIEGATAGAPGGDELKITRMSFNIIDGYLGMVRAAATDCDYAKATGIGRKALAARENMTDMSGMFRRPFLYRAKEKKE